MSIPIVMPKLGLTMTEGLVAKWLVQDGDRVEAGMPILEVNTDKASVETIAPAAGILRILIQAGQSVPTGQVLAFILQTTDETSAVPTRAQTDSGPELHQPILATPAAKRRARELGIDLDLVVGTGPEGRITEKDIEVFATSTSKQGASRSALVSPVARRMAEKAELDLSNIVGTGENQRITKEDVERAIAVTSEGKKDRETIGTGGYTGIPLSGVRAIIAERMLKSTQHTARVTLTTELDATELVCLYKNLKPELEKRGVKLSYEALFALVVAKALGEFPYMNATEIGGEIRLLDEIHIGLAVDTDRGLLVPVLRNADKKSIQEVAREVQTLVERTTEGKIMPEELRGGTFTITNLGMYEVDAFTPIINPPELAILGLGRIARRPAENEGQIALRHIMTLSLSFDHRLVDGAPAARFLRRIKQICEAPYLLLVNQVFD
jgi:pyruvate dehydrogenase E2 component (dihydrolipoamide acetyltransferase)